MRIFFDENTPRPLLFGDRSVSTMKTFHQNIRLDGKIGANEGPERRPVIADLYLPGRTQ